MTTFDPQVEVLCDECGCNDYWQPEYMYYDFSGLSGFHDVSDSAFAKWRKSESWTGTQSHTLCPDCSGGEKS